MPLYEYECTACKKHTEKIQKFSDVEITTCPHCGGVLRRVITAPAIAFKGGGWYADGYGNAKPAPSEGKAESKPDGSGKTEGAAATPAAESKAAASTESSSTPAPAAPAAPAPAAKT